MKHLKALVPAAAAAALVLGVPGPAGAADPPGRGASTGGLSTAVQKVREAAVIPVEQISLNLVMAEDPDQPGVTPGGGIEP